MTIDMRLVKGVRDNAITIVILRQLKKVQNNIIYMFSSEMSD